MLLEQRYITKSCLYLVLGWISRFTTWCRTGAWGSLHDCSLHELFSAPASWGGLTEQSCCLTLADRNYWVSVTALHRKLLTVNVPLTSVSWEMWQRRRWITSRSKVTLCFLTFTYTVQTRDILWYGWMQLDNQVMCI